MDKKSVFLNVPYDRKYEPYFVTLVSALVSLGLTPRCVLEDPEMGAGRLSRIYDRLRRCEVSIHDLSRVGAPARFNMPFELGLACGLQLGGTSHEIVVLDRERYRLDKTLSDYKGRDPLIYRSLDGLVERLGDAFSVVDGPSVPVLKREARILRKTAAAIARDHGGTIFRRVAFRTVVAAATQSAQLAGLIPP